jgi:hypothetical protein
LAISAGSGSVPSIERRELPPWRGWEVLAGMVLTSDWGIRSRKIPRRPSRRGVSMSIATEAKEYLRQIEVAFESMRKTMHTAPNLSEEDRAKINAMEEYVKANFSKAFLKDPKKKVADPEDDPEYRHQILTEKTLEQDTFQEMAELARGMSHFSEAFRWLVVKDQFSLLHKEDHRSHILVINGNDLPIGWDGARDGDTLLAELDSYGPYALKLVQLCVGLVVHSKSSVIDMNLDEIMARIRITVRSTEERTEKRKLVWRILMLIGVTSVKGHRPYSVYDLNTRSSSAYSCDEPLIKITPWRKMEEYVSKPGVVPLRVTIYAGPFILRHQGNDQVLQYCAGDILDSLALPNLKVIPSWTHRIKTNLQHFIRVNAVKVYYKWETKLDENGEEVNDYRKAIFGPITRRELLEEPCRVRPSIEALCKKGKESDPVRDYFEDAIKSLSEGETAILLSAPGEKVPYQAFGSKSLIDWSSEARVRRGDRQDWLDGYLDEKLELTPVRNLQESLSDIKDHKPNRKKRNKLKKASPPSE